MKSSRNTLRTVIVSLVALDLCAVVPVSAESTSEGGFAVSASTSADVQKELARAKAELEEWKAKLEAVEGEISDLNQRIQDLKSKFDITGDLALLDQIHEATQELEQLEDQRDWIQGKIAELEQYIAQLTRASYRSLTGPTPTG